MRPEQTAVVGQTPPAGNRYIVLDGLRGVAALVVMIYHYSMDTAYPLFGNAVGAVDLFFMLSGFVIAHSYAARLGGELGYGNYVVKRIIRLYPMYLAGFALGALTLFLRYQLGQIDASLTDITIAALCNAFMLPYFHHVGFAPYVYPVFPTNHASWSLFFELIASLALWPLARCPTRLLFGLVVTAFLLLMWAGYLDAAAGGQPVPLNPSVGWNSLNFIGGFPRVFYGFGLGVLLQRLVGNGRMAAALSRAPKLKRAWRGAGYHPLALYLLLLAVFSLPVMAGGGVFPILSLLLYPFILLAGAGGSHRHRLAQRLSAILGWLSYPVYCLHMPVGWLVELWADHAPLPVPAPVMATLITIGMATLVGRLYDAPIRAWLTRQRPVSMP